MGQFSASLRVPGDGSPIPATIDIGDGRIRLESGSHELGNWALADVNISQGPDGVRLSAEGEQVLLEVSEQAAFSAALGLNGQPAASPKTFKLPSRARSARHTGPKGAGAETMQVLRDTATSEAPPPKDPGQSREPNRFDRVLAKGEEALGKHLPGWVFTRGGAVVVLASLVVAVVFPSVVSTILLVVGVVLLVGGGVTMLDHVLAVRLLKGKVTPTQTLIAGGVLALVGVLFGLIA